MDDETAGIAPALAAKLDAVRGLPSPPRVAMLIIEASRDPNVSLGKVADVVTADPVITAKIMRMANSAAYSVRGGCKTLRRALLTLGLDAALIIALSFSLVISLRRDKSRGLDHEYFWRRSLLAATAAASLAKALGRPDGETLFLAALLQDIGMLALDKCEPDLYVAAGDLQRNHPALAEFEIARLGCDHADVSGWLLERWKLPGLLVESAISSHDRRVFSDDEFARCVALSGPLADVWLASDWNLSFRDLVTMAVHRLHLDDTQLGDVLDDLRQRIPETEAMFEKDLVDPESGMAALEEARELVMERGVNSIASDAQAPPQSPATAPVTLLGLQHRAEIDEVLKREFDSARQSGTNAAIMLACIDSLDRLRERNGLDATDRLLRETARVMLSGTGAQVIGQYGENEIVLWLQNCNHDGVTLAERRMLREFTGVLNKLSGQHAMQVSLTLGGAAMDETHAFEDFSQMLQAAQTALAAARSGGTARDRPVPAHSH